MKKHLFLEGLVQTGKSTLIRECITPYMDKVGGLSSQRLLDKDGMACGYRLVPASNFHLNTPYCPGASGTFSLQGAFGTKKDLSVFETLGIALLNTTGQVMLLDEIGGSELLVPPFRKKLYRVLGGDIPCIGVLKLNEKAAFMSRSADYPGEVVDANRRLREALLNQFDAKIILYEEEKRSIIKEEIDRYLKTIFS